jgi:hypothetical protein
MTTHLIVLAEYGSSGIWSKESNGVGEVDHEEIHLPPELGQRFDDWIELYWLRLPIKMRGVSPREADRVSLEQFNAIGRNLARELKAFVGSDVIVQYIPELPGIGEGPPELID